MHARMFILQPVICAFAVIAVAFHAWFWVACAVQMTHLGVGSSTDGLNIVICTPNGLRSTQLPDGTPTQPVHDTCPECSQGCAAGLQNPALAQHHPTSVAALIPAERLQSTPILPSPILRQARPRAPPVSGFELT